MSFVYSFEKLDVWKESRLLVSTVYNLTNKFPKNEQFGIINQMQRAAVSIPSNIAEGMGRSYLKEQQRFCEIAYGSLMELYCQLIISFDLGYINEQDLNSIKEQINSVSFKLNALKVSIIKRIE